MDDLFTLFTARLDAAGIESAVTGSVAAMLYGEPRLTHDIDVIVRLTEHDIEALVRAFPDEEFYCAPPEVIRVEASRNQRGHFNIIHHDTGFKADVYVAGSDPLHQWALAGRRRLPVAGGTIVVAPPEYVILRKLEYYREGGSAKHLEDIRGILRQQGEAIDRARLEERIDEQGLRAQWERATETETQHRE